jgi:regulator of cell morphogenesis and NO signaling
LNKVVAAHGAVHPELHEAAEAFGELEGELYPHMMKEEMVLFPWIKGLEAGTGPVRAPCASVEQPIRVMMQEHQLAGDDLATLRRLTRGYRPPAGACATYCTLLDGLAKLEADLHLHIHKENNILFPRAAELESLGQGRPIEGQFSH